jgi:hypothetical protein
MKIDWVSILFGAFGLSVLRLIWESIKFFISRNDTQNKKSDIFLKKQELIENLFNDLIISAVNIQELLQNFVEKNNVGNIIIFKLGNGGGLPQLATTQHISILNEAIGYTYKNVDGGISSNKKIIQNHVIGAEFQRLIAEMLLDSKVTRYTDVLEDGIFKSLLISDSINKIYMLPIAHIPELDKQISRGFLIFMSIQFVDDREFDAKLESDILILKEQINQIFVEFYTNRINTFGD